MEKILKAITKDFTWKVLSLLIATGLWFVGMNNHDPSILQDYDIPLTIMNKEKLTANNFVLLNERSLEASTINITFRGRRSQIANLTKAKNDIVAFIDLNPIDVLNYKDMGKVQSVTVKVQLPNSVNPSNYERVNIYPDTKEFTLDALISRAIEVEAVQVGKVEEGYIAMDSVVEPRMVVIQGARSIIDTVTSIRVEVDLKERTEDFTEFYEVKLLDEEGREVSQITKNREEVQVTVPIKKFARIPIVLPEIEGDIPEGYELIGLRVDPRHVEVVGTAEELASMPVFVLDPITIRGANQKEVYDLRVGLMGTRLGIKTGTALEATVTVDLEKQEVRTLEWPRENLILIGEETLPEDTHWHIEESISLMLRGIKANLDSLSVEDIQMWLDVENLDVGEHEILATVFLPDNVMLEEEVMIIMVIENEEVLSEEITEDNLVEEVEED